jgi:hypothetical protein
VLDDAHIHAPTLVEPNSGRGRPNRMFADTDPIRAFGAANSAQAADLGAVAAALSSMPGHAAGAMLGPVGTRFLAALADAVVQGPCAVATLSDRMEAGHLTTYASAGADHSTTPDRPATAPRGSAPPARRPGHSACLEPRNCGAELFVGVLICRSRTSDLWSMQGQ